MVKVITEQFPPHLWKKDIILREKVFLYHDPDALKMKFRFKKEMGGLEGGLMMV